MNFILLLYIAIERIWSLEHFKDHELTHARFEDRQLGQRLVLVTFLAFAYFAWPGTTFNFFDNGIDIFLALLMFVETLFVFKIENNNIENFEEWVKDTFDSFYKVSVVYVPAGFAIMFIIMSIFSSILS